MRPFNLTKPDKAYNNHPATRLLHDIARTLMTEQTQATGCAGHFPYDSSDARNGGDFADDHSDRPGTLTLPKYVYATYNEVMKNGWRMTESDEMDILGFLRLRAWDATKEQRRKKGSTPILWKLVLAKETHERRCPPSRGVYAAIVL